MKKYISNLLSSNPLCGISTYVDTLDLSNGAVTRKIRKIVLTGSENYGASGGNTWLTIGNDTLDFRGTANGVYCSHVPTVLRTDLATNTCCWGGGQIGDLIININDYSTETLKTYIANQYSTDTPVTIWFVLATTDTETITVPTGLTGTVNGYLTHTGTPTPTTPIYPTANPVTMWANYTPNVYNSGWTTASGQPEKYNGGWS